MQQESLNKLKSIFCAVLQLPPDDTSVENVRQLTARNWDSLAQVTLIVAIESEFGFSLPAADYARLTSFKAVALLLEEKGF